MVFLACFQRNVLLTSLWKLPHWMTFPEALCDFLEYSAPHCVHRQSSEIFCEEEKQRLNTINP